MSDDLLTRIKVLETHQAFQESTIEELNQTVIHLQNEVFKLKEQLRLMAEKMKATAPSMIASQAEETPPPHY